jgi:hypothetical protein
MRAAAPGTEPAVWEREWQITVRTLQTPMSSEDIDLKACAILERLSKDLSDAQVDYTCTQDMHAFSIDRGGIKHEVGFHERVLELKNIPDIEEVVGRLVEEIKASHEPRKIRIGNKAPVA